MNAAALPHIADVTRAAPWPMALRSHSGCIRAINEDRALGRAEVGLWAVADGMGGHDAGDVAAQLIVDSLAAADGAHSGWGVLDDVRHRLAAANAALAQRGHASGRTCGATIVALVARQGRCAWLWAGDSRGYRLRDGTLTAMTRDHSLVQALVDGGAITADDAKHHPRANIITRAVGADEALELELRHDDVVAGDLLLLCSDGLTGVLAEDDIAVILAIQPIDAAADALLAEALARGAPDNVTLILVRPL